jgi:hypothetical protein
MGHVLVLGSAPIYRSQALQCPSRIWETLLLNIEASRNKRVGWNFG